MKNFPKFADNSRAIDNPTPTFGVDILMPIWKQPHFNSIQNLLKPEE